MIKGYSELKLRKLKYNSFDIIYIDGSHITRNVLTDAVYGWWLLKKDGIIIFDDYLWKLDRPENQTPKIAIDAFLKVFSDRIEILHQEYQVIIRKITDY